MQPVEALAWPGSAYRLSSSNLPWLRHSYAMQRLMPDMGSLCRLINSQSLMLGQEPRQTTSNLGHLNKPSIQALIHGLNRCLLSLL